MYDRIIVPLDGSKPSESILPCARFLARTLQAKVELLHAVDPEVVAAFVNPARERYIDTVETGLRCAAFDYLRPLAKTFPDSSRVECSVEIGKAAETILRQAGEDKDALIAMATHGLSGVRRWLLGNVAEKVLHMTSNPLLLVRPGEKIAAVESAGLRTVIVPLDGSGLAERVLPHVVYLAKKIDLEVVLLRIYELPLSAYYVGEDQYPLPDLRQLTREVREEAEGYLNAKIDQLKSQGLTRVSSLLLEGHAAEKIIETAQQTGDNLLALCTHGRSGFRRLMLGTVTGRVVRYSGDPVLVIRAHANE
jgi:nucleotide-binding universal stress UspA family protein